MRLQRARVAKSVVSLLFITLFSVVTSAPQSHAGAMPGDTQTVLPASTVLLPDDAPTVAPVATLQTYTGGRTQVAIKYCLSYYNNLWTPSLLGPASNTIVPTTSQSEVLVTFPAPPAGKSYWIYDCTNGQGGFLLSWTPITGTSFVDHYYTPMGVQGATEGLPLGTLRVVTQTQQGPPGGGANPELMKYFGVSTNSPGLNKTLTQCYTDADQRSQGAIPLVDGQSIKFTTANRNVVDFLPTGVAGSGTTSSTSVVVSGGKACVTYVGTGVGSTTIGPELGQSYQVKALKPDAAPSSSAVLNGYCVTSTNLPNPSTGIVTCNATSKWSPLQNVTINADLVLSPTSLTLAPGANGNISITSPLSPLGTQTLAVKFVSGTDVLTNANIATTGVTFAAISNTGTFTANASSSLTGTGTYRVSVQGVGYSMAAFTVTVGAQSAPGAPKITNAVAGNGNATVTFEAPTSAGTSPITSYTVTSSPAGGSCTVTAPATSCLVSPLNNNTTYTFTATATSSAGTSGTSNTSNPVTPIAPAAPSAPLNPTVTVNAAGKTNTSTDFSVSFDPPASEGSSPITGYTAVLYIDGNATAMQVSGTTSPIVITAPQPMTAGSYTFKVFATNTVGAGTLSAATAATTVAAPASPAAPTIVPGKNSFTVTPATVSGATSYTVNVYPSGTTASTSPMPSPIASCTVVSPATSCEPLSNTTPPTANLSASISYAVFTTASNAFLTSAPNVATATTASSGPTVAPSWGAGASVTVTPGAYSLSVSWSVANNAEYYRVNIIPNYIPTENPNLESWYLYPTDTSIQLTDLDPNHSYKIEVEGYNSFNGISYTPLYIESSYVYPWGPPVAPLIDYVSSDSTTATVHFYPLTVNRENTSNFPVLKYILTALIDGVKTPLGLTLNSPFTLDGVGEIQGTITGLTTGVKYQIAVSATTTIGDSPLAISDLFTPSLPPAPLAPTSVSAATPTAGGTVAGQVKVTFTPPTAPAGTTISSYTFTAIPSSGTPIVVTVAAGSVTCAATCSYTMSGLSRTSGPYTFTVSATNQTGTGSASTASAPYSMPQVPGAPSITSVDLRFNSALNAVAGQDHVEFTAPSSDGGAPITLYRVRVYPTPPTGYGTPNDAQTVQIYETSTAGNMLLTMRAPNSNGWFQYETVTVTAINMVGESAESVMKPLIAGQPGGVDIVGIGDTQVTVKPALPTAAAYPAYVIVTAYDSSITAQNSAQTYINGHTSTISPNVSEATFLTNNGEASANSGYCTVTLPQRTCTITSLTNEHTYKFTIRGFNSSGGGYFASTSTTAKPISISSLAPTNVQATGGDTNASVFWDLPDLGTTPINETVTISSYNVTAFAITGETITATTATRGTSGSPYLFTGLTNGKTYTFVVSAVITASGTGGYVGNYPSSGSAPSNAVIPAGVPSKPAAPAVTYSNGAASLAYSAPSSNGSAITKYTFTATPVGGGTAIVQTTLNLTSPYLFTNLDQSKTYNFKVMASNSIGDSTPSDTSTAATQTLVIHPIPVSVAQGTAYVGFSPGYLLSSSVIDPTINNSGWVEPTCATAAAYTSSTAVGTYAITCSGGNGGALYTLSYESDTLTVTNNAPISPTGVTASLANTQAVVSFTGSPNATRYTVTAYVNGVATSITATGTSSPITVSGLIPGVSYSFVVTAGLSPYASANTSIGSIPTVAAVMPKSTLYVIPDALITTFGSPSVTYTVNYQTTAFDTSTAVTPNMGNTGWIKPTCTISPSYTSTTAVGNYTISCSGGNGGSLYTLNYGYTSILGVKSSVTFPSAPTNVTATASGATGATIAFTAPSIATPALSSYTVTALPVGGGTPVTTTVSAPATSAAITGLTPGTTYNFQVTATNSGGVSSPGFASLAIAGTPPSSGGSGGSSGGGGGGYVAAPVVIPTAPTGISATIGGTTGAYYAVVSFTPAATNGVTTSYTVTAQPGGISASGTGSPIRINGLTPGVAYTFTVTATNSAGTSSSSTGSAAFVIPAVPVVNPLATVPTSVALGNVPVLLNGVAQNVQLVRNVANGTLNLSAKDWSLKVSAYSETGKFNTPTASLQLVGYQGGNVGAEGTGFAPNSAVAFYMFSKTYTLGTHTTDSSGSFNITDAIPSDIAVGEHTVQVVGYAPDGKVRSASIKITVKAAAIATPVVTKKPVVVPTPKASPTTPSELLPLHSATTKIFFNLNASFVDAKARATMKKFVAAVTKHKGPYKISVVGMVEPTPVNPLPVAVLSKARAVATAKLLKEYGLVGKYSIKGGGLADKKGASSRYAQITVTWQE